MRFFQLPLLLCFFAAAAVQPVAHGQEDPSQYPEGFKTAIGEAGIALRDKKFQEALKALDKADKEKPNTSMSYNLRGAVYTEMKDYPKAKEFFEKAKGVSPQQFAPQFNIAELLFVQKQYKEARSAFQKLQTAFPKEELLQFKIYLTYLLDGTEAEAKAQLDAFKFPSNTPAYYFAHASWAFKHQDLKDAQSWIQSSLNIFPMNQNEIFIESIEDLGWITKGDSKPAAAPSPSPAAAAAPAASPAAARTAPPAAPAKTAPAAPASSPAAAPR